ncbi:MAG: class I tRNA ligase family protein, partial [Bacteroidales bacterium]
HDRFKARKKMVALLTEKGQLVKIEDIANKVGYSERTDEVIEPKLSMQWFMKMSELAKPALDVVMNDDIKLYPVKFKNTYRHWMENVKDWCISRQLWWGHRIPAYYLPNGEIVAALSPEDALKKAKEKYKLTDLKIEDLQQDEDVLDTWFSSWLWPVSVFDGIRNPDNADIKYYYPTNDLITAPEILFFWVARMIMAGLEYRKDIPFKNVYLTGIVRDKLGRKMSKSLGNSPDPLQLMGKYSADGVRIGMLFCSPAGNDLLFDESLCEQGRNFCNKIWNAFRLIKGWKVDNKLEQPGSSLVAVEWFNAKMCEEIVSINDHFDKYRVSDALMSIYKLVWDDFCSWYLEMIKPVYLQPIDKATLETTIEIFEKLLRLLHPFMPFITEELYHLISERKEKDCIIVASLPEAGKVNKKIIEKFEIARDVIIEVRNVRAQKNIPNKETIKLSIKKNYNEQPDLTFDTLVCKLCNLESLDYVNEKVDGAFTFVVRNTEFYIPLSSNINTEEEIKKLTEEINYTKGFLQSVMKKLSNKNFVANAKAEVVESERKKMSDAEARIKVIEEQIASLKK